MKLKVGSNQCQFESIFTLNDGENETATPSTTKMISQDLAMSQYRVVKESPDRPRMFLDRQTTLDTWNGNTSYEEILMPIAQSLKMNREMYPLSFIYMHFQYCGFAYHLFESTM